jgi:nucleoside-diphosphate-sugar epimerase
MRSVITGATGLIGSHIALQLALRGERVRALVRPSSDAGFLKDLGVEISLGDLNALESVRAVVTGADTVYHCASRVGDFGAWKMFQTEVVDTTRNVMAACRTAEVSRALHVSSVAVYGHRPYIPPRGLTEDQSIRQHWRFADHYGRAKAEAEALARAIYPEVTIVRPTWVFGPGDRHGLPRLIQALRTGWVSLVGSGENLLNIIHAKDVAEGAILAATHAKARGQIYHLCSEGEVTQRQFLDALADAIGCPRVTRRFPFPLAYFGGFLGEIIGRSLRLPRAPFISRYSVSRIGRPVAYRIDKARAELGWNPKIKILESLRQLLEQEARDRNQGTGIKESPNPCPQPPAP